jgi:type IV secretion system protein VirD4
MSSKKQNRIQILFAGLFFIGLTAFGFIKSIIEHDGSLFFFSLFAGVAALFVFSKIKTEPKKSDLNRNFVYPRDLGLLADRGISLGGTALDHEGNTKNLVFTGDSHLLTIAMTGSGKMTTNQSYLMLDQFDRSMLVIDPKGQLAAISVDRRRKMGHKVVVLNPFKLHTGSPWFLPCHSFNPLAVLDPAGPSFVADVARLANNMIEHSGHDTHWSDCARDLFSWLIMWVIFEEEDKTMNRVRDLLCKPESEFCKLAVMAAANPVPALRNKAGGFVELTDEMRGIISTAKRETVMFDDPLIRESFKGGAEFKDFAQLKRELTTVFLVLPADYIASHNKWLRVMIAAAFSAFYANPKGHKVLMVLDEAAQLGHLDDLKKGAGLIRDYGVQLWPFFQDWNQIKAIYSDFAESLVSGSGVVQCYRPNDDVTWKWMIEKIGTFKDTRISANTGQSASGASSGSSITQIDRLYTVQELSNILGERGQLIFKDGKVCGTGRADYYQHEPWKNWAQKNPYHEA